MDWYYAKNNERVGPITASELSQLNDTGAITSTTLIWREGWTDWRPFRESAPALTEETGMAACVECGRKFPAAEMVQYEDVWVCAGCKPIFFQKIKEGVPIRAEMNYAGFWIRFLARFVDGIILQIASYLLALGIGFLAASMMKGENKQIGVGLFVWGLSILIAASYETYFIGRFGATLGKMACRLRVVTAAGEPVHYPRALGRYFGTFLSGIIFCIGYLMAAFDDEKRALHDRICDTRVIRMNA